MPTVPQATFYFDLGSPYAYLAAERLPQALPAPVSWQPVSLGALFKFNGRSSWSLGDPAARRAGMTEVEHRARQYGLAPLCWPDPWPSNYLLAMRVATFAFGMGHGPRFAVNAFRRAFQHGWDLGVPEHVFAAAVEAGLDQGAVRDASSDPEVKLELRNATNAAHELGVFGVPTIAVADELFWGEDRLPDAAAALERLSRG